MTDQINFKSPFIPKKLAADNDLQDKAQESMELRNILFSKHKDIKKSKISKLERLEFI